MEKSGEVARIHGLFYMFLSEQIEKSSKWRVVNARDGSGVAIRPDRVQDRAAVVMRVWETVRCRTDRMVGLTMCLWF